MYTSMWGCPLWRARYSYTSMLGCPFMYVRLSFLEGRHTLLCLAVHSWGYNVNLYFRLSCLEGTCMLGCPFWRVCVYCPFWRVCVHCPFWSVHVNFYVSVSFLEGMCMFFRLSFLKFTLYNSNFIRLEITVDGVWCIRRSINSRSDESGLIFFERLSFTAGSYWTNWLGRLVPCWGGPSWPLRTNKSLTKLLNEWRIFTTMKLTLIL
jgi:hypothetical protein